MFKTQVEQRAAFYSRERLVFTRDGVVGVGVGVGVVIRSVELMI